MGERFGRSNHIGIGGTKNMDPSKLQFANKDNGLHHKREKKTNSSAAKKTNKNNGNDDTTSFHPQILFCGECASCASPPPAIGAASFSNSFTIDDDDDDDQNDEESPRFLNSSSSGVIAAAASTASLRLRVYYQQESTGRLGFLKTMLMDLDGVTNVHMSKLPPPPSSIDSTNVSSSSQIVTIEYNPFRPGEASAAATMTYNPQEAIHQDNDVDRHDNNDVSIYQAILTRLNESRFDYAVLPNNNDALMTFSSTTADSTESLPNNSDNSNKMPDLKIQKVELTTCRTRLRVSGICCSSEVPAVRSILRPMPGVHKLGVNVATKIVFIDHDPSIITAELLAAALNEERFGAEIVNTEGGGGAGVLLLPSSLTTNDDGDDSCTKNDLQASSFESIMSLPRSNFVESTFIIPGMMTYTQEDKMETSCPIGKVLRQNFFRDQLRAFHLHAQSQTLKVEHDPSLLSADRIHIALVSGLKGGEWGRIELAHDGATEGLTLPALSNECLEDNEGGETVDDGGRRQYCFPALKINIIFSGLFWIVSLLSYVDDSWSYLNYAGIGSVIFGLPPVALKAYLTVRRCQFDANCMMVTAALGALALGEYDEAASVSFLFAISEWLEARATKKARRALGEIVSLRPDYAHVIDPNDGSIVIIPATGLPVGCLVSVRTGDKVPADGIVVEGTSTVDESSLTGEARPIDKRPGSEVSGGSINVGSTQLVIRTTSTVGDSTLSRLIQLVEEAQANASETEKLVDAFARKYTPFVLVIAFCLCTFPWFFGGEVGRHWALNGLIFIIIACPCALTIRLVWVLYRDDHSFFHYCN